MPVERAIRETLAWVVAVGERPLDWQGNHRSRCRSVEGAFPRHLDILAWQRRSRPACDSVDWVLRSHCVSRLPGKELVFARIHLSWIRSGGTRERSCYTDAYALVPARNGWQGFTFRTRVSTKFSLGSFLLAIFAVGGSDFERTA